MNVRYSNQRYFLCIYICTNTITSPFVDARVLIRWKISGFSYAIPAREKKEIDTFRPPNTCAACRSWPWVTKFLECLQPSFSVFCARSTCQRISEDNKRFSCHTYHCSSSKCSQPTAPPFPADSCNWTPWSKDARILRTNITSLPYLSVIARTVFFLWFDHPTRFLILNMYWLMAPGARFD